MDLFSLFQTQIPTTANKLLIAFSGGLDSTALLSLVKKLREKRPHLSRFIRQVLEQDPRPAYQQGKPSNRIYGMSLYEFNVKWRIKAGTVNCVEVIEIEKDK